MCSSELEGCPKDYRQQIRENNDVVGNFCRSFIRVQKKDNIPDEYIFLEKLANEMCIDF